MNQPTHRSALLTDLYQLTMANGYYDSGRYQEEAVFHLYFRRNPFGGAFALNCGLELAIDYLQNLTFPVEDIQYLGSLKASDGYPLFSESFLNYLQRWQFKCDVDAIPEGTVVFPNQPLLRIKGPIIQAQLLETTLLNIINFSTLIATKAARISQAAGEDAVLEFGLRRAQGPDGGLSASRAAFIGGCNATSNVLAGQCYGIPVRGTHAHSWVMAHASELDAFRSYAEIMPANCTLLVDTYDTHQGVENAIIVGRELRERGYDLNGIRLDSGDLAQLSRDARAMLDQAGFTQTKIVASNSLDEYEIKRLKAAGARIDIWGVGTRLSTAYDQPALGGVYKMAAIRAAGGTWDYKMKVSEQAIKRSNPGYLQVRRQLEDGVPRQDVIYNEWEHDPLTDGQSLLVPIFRQGRKVYQSPSLVNIQAYAKKQISLFDEKTIASYSIKLEPVLAKLKESLQHQLTH